MHIGSNRVPNGMQDHVTQPIYDSRRVDVAPYGVELFCTPIGQRDPGARGDERTSEDTNMYLASQLPQGNEFYITQIGVYFVPNIEARASSWRDDAADTLRVLGCGFLEFRVMNRIYLRLAPLAALPPGFPMYWAHDEAKLSQLLLPTVVEGESVHKVPDAPGFKITPIYIAAGQGFGVSIHSKERFALHNPGRLGVILYGQLIREIQ